jgi:hypothetical protein
VFPDEDAMEPGLKAFEMNVDRDLDTLIGGIRFGLNDLLAPKPVHDVLALIT